MRNHVSKLASAALKRLGETGCGKTPQVPSWNRTAATAGL